MKREELRFVNLDEKSGDPVRSIKREELRFTESIKRGELRFNGSMKKEENYSLPDR